MYAFGLLLLLFLAKVKSRLVKEKKLIVSIIMIIFEQLTFFVLFLSPFVAFIDTANGQYNAGYEQ